MSYKLYYFYDSDNNKYSHELCHGIYHLLSLNVSAHIVSGVTQSVLALLGKKRLINYHGNQLYWVAMWEE